MQGEIFKDVPQQIILLYSTGPQTFWVPSTTGISVIFFITASGQKKYQCLFFYIVKSKQLNKYTS